jgi:hypothetical protein
MGARIPAAAPPAAVPQVYRGVRFRSTLEARWAVFFDRRGIPWRYEPHCVALGWCGYLPDFLLWSGRRAVYAEVKRAGISEHEGEHVRKLRDLTTLTGRPAMLLVGPPAQRWYPLLLPGQPSAKRYQFDGRSAPRAPRLGWRKLLGD